MSIAGKHVLLDTYGVNAELLKDKDFIEKVLMQAAIEAKATILHTYFHKFGGEGGVTGLVALAESHISIHTWPENNFAAIDIFMCGNSNPELAIDYIKEKLIPTNAITKPISRGIELK